MSDSPPTRRGISADARQVGGGAEVSKAILVAVLIVMGYFGVKWKVAWIRSITCQCQCQKEVQK